MKKNFIFIIILILIVVLLHTFSRKEIIPIPSDSSHENITDNKVCLDCHGKDKENPLKKEHPPKEQCLICHKYKKAG